MGTVASLDIDAQKGFTPLCPNELPVAGGDDIVAALNAQATLASLRIGSKDAHPANAVWVASEPATMLQPLDFPNADLTWPVHCVPGSKGFELLDGLPAPSTTTSSSGRESSRICTPMAPVSTIWPSAAAPASSNSCKPVVSPLCWSAAWPPTTASRPACCNCAAPVSG